MNQSRKDCWDKAKILFEIVAIIALVFYGHILNSTLKKREINLQLVQMAVDILRTEPSNGKQVLREWAIEIVDNYSGVTITKQIKEERNYSAKNLKKSKEKA